MAKAITTNEEGDQMQKIKVKCYKCEHEWEEDLVRYQQEREINRDWRFWRRTSSPPPSRAQVYRFTCPNDGTRVVVEL